MKVYKPNFYNAKVRSKLLISILSTTILIFLVVMSYIVFKTENNASISAFNYVDVSAMESANMVRSELEGDFAICRTIMLSFKDYKEYDAKQRIYNYNKTLKTVVANTDQFMAVWCDWELNNLDVDYNKEHGRESFTFYKDGDDIKYKREVVDTSDNVSGIYYDIKANSTEILTEPYFYSYSSKKSEEILMASVCIPMMDDDRFIGLVGADVELERIHNLTDNISPFEGSSAMMISSEGMVFTHSKSDDSHIYKVDSLDLGKNLDFKFSDKLNDGKAFSYTYIDSNGKEFYVSFAPLTLGFSPNYWYLGIIVPIDVILEEARFDTIVSVIVVLLGILILAFIIWIISNYITKPLVNTTKVLKELASGNIRETGIIRIQTHDELAEMARAVNTLIGSLKSSSDFANDIGDGDMSAKFKPISDKDVLGNSLVNMRNRLVELKTITDRNNWLQESIVKLSEVLQGEKSLAKLGNDILVKLAKILDIPIAAVYINDNDVYKLIASYAYNTRKANTNEFKAGEGLIGQAALEQKTLIFSDIPDNYIEIRSGLGQVKPSSVLIVPMVYQNRVVGVLELGTTKLFNDDHLGFIQQVSESIAIAFRSIGLRTEMEELLMKTQEQAEELSVQQEELVEANKELKSQTEALKVSEEELQQQQEELRVTNEELEVKTISLERQKADVSEKNLQLENAQQDLERKANELGVASKYKSDFLANMSHELRTPLNSLLILSRHLADNSDKNLTSDQTEAAEIIYKSGNDLLSMINDILDLSKIESGRMTINVENVDLQNIAESTKHYFKHITDQKGISLEIKIEDDVSPNIMNDQQKIEQIIKNFVSNGIKFTTEGGIKVVFHKPKKGVELLQSNLKTSDAFAISVIDTGLGIPENKQLEIFEAFRQADTSISKNFGGTGLGLSISKELAKLLGGEIQLQSEEGNGSTFTVYLPRELKASDEHRPSSKEAKIDKISTEMPAKKAVKLRENHFVDDDYSSMEEGEDFILVIEDDPVFAKILVKECRSNEFKCVAVPSGEEGLLLSKNKGVAAIILDINLPGINGWGVLKLLKDDPDTRHIPVHIMSGDEATIDSNRMGAIGFLRKPVDRNAIKDAFGKIQDYINKELGSLLIVEDDDNLRKSIRKIIGDDGISITDASNGGEVLKLLKKQTFDCMILDLGLPDMTGFQLIEELERLKINKPPIIVYTGKDITREENEMLEKYAETVIIKGVKSSERLLDETSLFMHRVVADMPEKHQEIINTLHNKEDVFKNRKVMVVDDDMRNVFALTSLLTKNGMEVVRADNGKTAIDLLEKEENIDMILMDIMMPVMDGYEAMNKIRKISKYRNTPIIALTAKAMKDDKQKCIDAGASDYMAKPIDIEKLLSLMRVWLYK